MADLLMQTDFGGTSGAMIGVSKIVDPSLRIFEITGNIPKFNVIKAGESLAEVLPYWAPGTVFVSVVDPGVGTSRKACVALTDTGHYIVTPDNGCLAVIRDRFGIREIREIDETVNRYRGNEWSNQSDIFHGRDIFAYTGALLASGKRTYEEVGPSYPVEEIVLPKENYE